MIEKGDHKGLSLEQIFADPPSIYRTAPLWAWNDAIEEKQISTQLKELKEHGFGGAFVHPRPGLVTEYLSDEWFDKWQYALETARELGMKLYIYDENSYPSGFAGGHVSSQLPDCLATSARCRIENAAEIRMGMKSEESWMNTGSIIKVYACENKPQEDASIALGIDLTDLPRNLWENYGEWFLIIEMMDPKVMSWMGGFANVDLMRPEVTEEFLKCTHEAYYQRFSEEFGRNIPAIFTDEPSLTGSAIYQDDSRDVQPFSFWFAEEFRKLNGYSILQHLPAIFVDATSPSFKRDTRKVRFDYYNTIRHLWTVNTIEPISKWCENHNIAYTGHYMEDGWPLAKYCAVSPATMSYYEYMQWPAVDILMTFRLKNKPTDTNQIILQEVRSAANQFGKERVLCEAYGAGGWDAGLSDFRRIGDWLLVNGINFINQHLTFTTITGARKRDHAQSFDWREPWWEDYARINHYHSRLSAILSQGCCRNRILVMNPTTTGFLMPPSSDTSHLDSGRITGQMDVHDYLTVLQGLSDAQWDFDLGDEFILQRHGQIADNQLIVCKQKYSVIILTHEMKNLLSSTVMILEEFLKAGGWILSLGMPGDFVDGEIHPEDFKRLASCKNWIAVARPEEIEEKIRTLLPARIQPVCIRPTGFSHYCRMLEDDRRLFFFTNHSMGKVEEEIELEGAYAEIWDAWAGKVLPAVYENRTYGHVTIKISLERWDSLLLMVSDKAGMQAVRVSEQYKTPIFLHNTSEFILTPEKSTILSESKNVLMIDYCDLELDGQIHRKLHTMKANHLAYQERGFPADPWDNAIQYKRRVLDRNQFARGSGFAVSYEFHVADEFYPENLSSVIEHPEFYSVALNGYPLTQENMGYWLDHHMGSYPIREFLRAGSNVLTLTTDVFDIMHEIEPVYIRGDFSIEPCAGSPLLIPLKALLPGSWTQQGYPFYEGAFIYSWTFNLSEAEKESFYVRFGEILCTSAMLTVNGRFVSLVTLDGRNEYNLSEYALPGENRIDVRVSGSLKNLVGPHHDPDKPRNTAWPQMWRKAPKVGQPALEDYDLMDYGLIEPPVFLTYRNN